MSFREAEITDTGFAGIANLLRGALSEPTYSRNPDQVYENMDGDPLIGVASITDQPVGRVELLTQISPHRADPARIKGETSLFCRGHLQEGPLFPNGTITTFVRVSTFERVANGIAHSGSPLTLDEARGLLRDAMSVAPSATRLIRQRSDLGDKNLSRYQMWAFPAADSANPVAEIGPARQEAVNILGLGDIEPLDEVIAFGYRLPAGTEPRRPTAWDAGCFACWRPGGRTFRLDVDDYGLNEVVHDRITGEHLVATIDVLP